MDGACQMGSLPVCCIQRNPTKGIERSSGLRSLRAGVSRRVAFNEIPQRELRAELRQLVPGPLPQLVAFNEIPQRELRVYPDYVPRLKPHLVLQLHSTKSHKGN